MIASIKSEIRIDAGSKLRINYSKYHENKKKKHTFLNAQLRYE